MTTAPVSFYADLVSPSVTSCQQNYWMTFDVTSNSRRLVDINQVSKSARRRMRIRRTAILRSKTATESLNISLSMFNFSGTDDRRSKHEDQDNREDCQDLLNSASVTQKYNANWCSPLHELAKYWCEPPGLLLPFYVPAETTEYWLEEAYNDKFNSIQSECSCKEDVNLCVSRDNCADKARNREDDRDDKARDDRDYKARDDCDDKARNDAVTKLDARDDIGDKTSEADKSRVEESCGEKSREEEEEEVDARGCKSCDEVIDNCNDDARVDIGDKTGEADKSREVADGFADFTSSTFDNQDHAETTWASGATKEAADADDDIVAFSSSASDEKVGNRPAVATGTNQIVEDDNDGYAVISCSAFDKKADAESVGADGANEKAEQNGFDASIRTTKMEKDDSHGCDVLSSSAFDKGLMCQELADDQEAQHTIEMPKMQLDTKVYDDNVQQRIKEPQIQLVDINKGETGDLSDCDDPDRLEHQSDDCDETVCKVSKSSSSIQAAADAEGGPQNRITVEFPSNGTAAQLKCTGVYTESSMRSNGQAVWTNENEDRFLYLANDGHWYIGDEEEMENDFEECSGYICQGADPLNPYNFRTGKWERYSNEQECWYTDAAISVVRPCSAEGAKTADRLFPELLKMRLKKYSFRVCRIELQDLLGLWEDSSGLSRISIQALPHYRPKLRKTRLLAKYSGLNDEEYNINVLDDGQIELDCGAIGLMSLDVSKCEVENDGTVRKLAWIGGGMLLFWHKRESDFSESSAEEDEVDVNDLRTVNDQQKKPHCRTVNADSSYKTVGRKQMRMRKKGACSKNTGKKKHRKQVNSADVDDDDKKKKRKKIGRRTKT
eukprot:TRINITY_DN561_c0_g1_i2.p1 TRINITY_DN561_c0_g1~~TRINITY_DN561_c0_g1_i2.p1  ORF type:complete len:840 (-),score=169.21 TRINITY_DN561_c0_g1_i2:782-3301(-)